MFDVSGLPALPEGFFWAVREEMGNYDDGFHVKGSCVAVGIRSWFKVFFVKGSVWVSGVKVCLADPRIPGDVEAAADDVYKEFVEVYLNRVDNVLFNGIGKSL